MRVPSLELQQRYRAEKLWLDKSLGVFFDESLERCAHLEVRFWSEVAPYRGTFGDVHRQARRFATGLAQRGVQPGDVLTYQLPNRVEAMIALYGAAMAGAVVVPVVHFYGPTELQFILTQLAAKLHLTTATFGSSEYLEALDGFRRDVPSLEQVVLVGEGSASWTEAFSEVIDEPPLAQLPLVDPMMPATIGYTSGTTSAPKGVIHVSNSIVGEAQQLARYDVGTSRPLLTGAPLAHSMGMTGGAIIPLLRNTPTHLVDRWIPGQVLAIILEAGLSSGSGSTYFLTSLLDDPSFTPAHAALIESVGLGGSPVPGAVCDRAESLGVTAVRSYGSTEHPTSVGAQRSDPPERRKYTEGRPLDGCEIRIVDDEGHDLPPGETGEILSRGADLFFGYVDAKLTTQALDKEGWYHTEDLAVLDAEGYITIVDRKKDIIIRGGENISASEVEEILLRMPGLSEVAVVAAPDARFGEHSCAFVTLTPDASAPSLDEVRSYFRRAGVARQKWPEEIQMVDQFPRTPSGKIKKQQLRDQLRRGEAAST